MEKAFKFFQELIKRPVIKSKKINFGPYFETRRRIGENKVTRNQDQLKDFFDAVIIEQDIFEKEKRV